MSFSYFQKAKTGVELTVVLSTGIYVAFSGVLLGPPSQIIFDNQGTSAVIISTDGVNAWRTFPAGEALVLDMPANAANADYYSFPKGTLFYGNGTTGGAFSISYLYGN